MHDRNIKYRQDLNQSTVSQLPNRFQQTGNMADRPRSGRPCKTTPWEDSFLTTSSLHNRFPSSWKVGHLLRNATSTRFATGQSGIGCTPLDWKRAIPTLHSVNVMELSSLLLQQHNIGIFQHDNARSHTARHTQNILRIHNVNVLQWPARSPDLSPIEYLWDHLGRQVRERHDVNNICDLERALQAEWVRIPLQVIRKLICSFTRHCLAVLAANGGHTRYLAVFEFLRLTP